MSLPLIKGALRVLDFDIEQRPLTYWVPDRPTSEITSIAAAWIDQPYKVKVWLLGRDDPTEMLLGFTKLYEEAGMVTGHYIRRFDLPQIQAALFELGLPTLGPKLTEDTKNDLIGWGDQPKTQEYLSETLGVAAQKVQMTQAQWREANRLTPAGLKLTEARCAGDVRQHMELRVKLREAGLLKSPRTWRP